MATPRPPVRRSADTPRRSRDDLDAPIDAIVEPLSPHEPMAATGPVVEVPPAPEASPAPKLHTDDLMALVDMDPSELAAYLDDAVAKGTVSVGDKITAPITRVGMDTLFVELGGKSEGQLERSEFPDGAVGTTITAFVVAIDEWGIQLSKQLQGAAASEMIEDAMHSGVPIEAYVASRNKGGYEVRVGSVRAFCPASLISRLPDMDPDSYVGQTLTFRVLETGDKIVLSRKALQEDEVAEQAEKIWSTIVEGQEFRGTVRNTAAFGFFVDIGGIDGLVPKREISWGGVEDPRTAVRVGQAVDVRVISVDHATKKLTFSCRNLQDDPWQRVGTDFQTGGVYIGTVVRAEAYGVFIELDTGLSGLMHISKIAGDPPKVGTTIEVRLHSIDVDQRRLDLGPASGEALSDPAAGPAPTEIVKGVVVEVQSNGVVVRLDDGRDAWLDARDVDLDAGTVLAQKFRRGKHIEGRVTGNKGGKIRLTTKSDEAGEDRAWRQAARVEARNDKGFGTMAGLLKGLKL